MPTYLVLIYGDERRWEQRSPEERRRIEAGHADFAAAAGPALLGGHELRRGAAARTLRPAGSARPLVTDGPFLETKEMIGGYYLIEATDLDHAATLAERLPELASDHGGVEIRPVVARE